MTNETRPTGEQLRFISTATGDHILDDYFEAAEIGGRTLADILSDLFDNTTGAFRDEIFQFRVNNATRIIEFRVGDFPDAVTGWIPLDNGNVIRWRGDYATATAYDQTDLVKYAGSVYICTANHTSSTPAPGSNFALMLYAEDLRGPPAETSASINFVIDGGELPLTTGNKGSIAIPFDCAINSWTLIADTTGSCAIDIGKATYANFPTSTSIVAAAPPTLTAAQKATSATLTGWTTAIAANDILTFNVTSTATIKRVSVSLKITRA